MMPHLLTAKPLQFYWSIAIANRSWSWVVALPPCPQMDADRMHLIITVGCWSQDVLEDAMCLQVCVSELEDQKVSRNFLPSAGFPKGRAGSDLSGGLSSFTKLTRTGRSGLFHRQRLEGAILLFVQPRPDNPGLFCSADAEMEAFFCAPRNDNVFSAWSTQVAAVKLWESADFAPISSLTPNSLAHLHVTVFNSLLVLMCSPVCCCLPFKCIEIKEGFSLDLSVRAELWGSGWFQNLDLLNRPQTPSMKMVMRDNQSFATAANQKKH